MNRTFDLKISNQCKGIAIICMMFHHLVPYTEFTSGPVIWGISRINDAFWMIVVTLCVSLLFAVPIQKLTRLISDKLYSC